MSTAKPLPAVHDLTQDDPQTVADECMIPVVWCDHQATRRQRLHGVNIPGNEHCFTSTHINEVLDHLSNEGFVDAIFICETPRRTHLACYIEFQPLAGSETPI